MASRAQYTGNDDAESRRAFPDDEAEDIFAKALGQTMRRQRTTNAELEREGPYKERKIEIFRSFTERGPVTFGDFLEMAALLGPDFVTACLSSMNMYAAEYKGLSPEKIAADAIQLLEQITGERR